MTAWTLLLATAAIALALSLAMAVAWGLRQWTGNSGWVDVTWTFGLGTVGALAALFVLPGEPGPHWRQLAVAALLALWAVRLGSHIAQRTLSIADDPRYAKLADEWGADAAPGACSGCCRSRRSSASRWRCRYSWRPTIPIPAIRLLDLAAMRDLRSSPSPAR